MYYDTKNTPGLAGRACQGVSDCRAQMIVAQYAQMQKPEGAVCETRRGVAPCHKQAKWP